MLTATGVGLPLFAQEIEPRTYSNAPVGVNFLVAGYAYTEGGVAFDPTVPLTDAHITVNGTALAYLRTFAVGGRTAKFDVVLPYASLSGTAEANGVPVERNVSGFGDPRFRFAINLLGGPAMPLQDFRNYRQDLIVGFSLTAWAPLGQYDEDRLVNIGTNRWALKPELGLSKSVGAWTLELAGGVMLFQDNDEFFGGVTRKQDPVYSVQGGLIRNFTNGMWASLSGTWYSGGRTTVNGVRKNDLQENSRIGAAFSLPINRNHSVKLLAHTGVSVRTGSDFDAVSVTWQYRWGGGF